MLATALAVAAMVISIASAITSARTSYQVNGSGFRASQALLTDLATLLASLRTISIKGAMVRGGGHKNPIPIDAELVAIRTFMTSTSGLALSLYAGKVGSAGASNDPKAGAWRVLQMEFTDLTSAAPTTAEDSEVAGIRALRIERTLSTLNKDSIKEICAEIKNLPNVLSSLTESRRNDFLLKILDGLDPPTAEGHEVAKKRLRQVKDSGVTDPTADLWLALLEDDEPAGRDALARGADRGVSLEEILDRYKDLELD